MVAPEALEAAVAQETERLRGLDAKAYVGTKARINAAALAAIRTAIAEEAAAVGVST